MMDFSKLKWSLLPVVRLFFRLTGRSWNDFYRWLLNRLERSTRLEKILSRPREGRTGTKMLDWAAGEYHAEFMARHGVRPDHVILDYGCGYGRTAIPLLRQQTSGGYIGVELSDERLRLAREWVAREGLDGKNVRLVLSGDNTISYLQDKSVDVIWSYSVFNHMPDRELSIALAAFHRVLRPDGLMFFYFVTPGPDDGRQRSGSELIAKFTRNDEDAERLVKAAGFSIIPLSDWLDHLPQDERPVADRIWLLRP